MFDCQYVMYVTNFKPFYTFLHTLNDSPYGILFYFKTFLRLIDIQIIICLNGIYQVVLRDYVKLTKHICFCEIIYF